MAKNNKLLKKILKNQGQRVIYLENDFLSFLIYYFHKHMKYPNLASCMKHWIGDAKRFKNQYWVRVPWKNIYIEWHRELWKTTIMGMAYELRLIYYKKVNFVCNLCYDKAKARALNKLVMTEMIKNKLLINDFWVLFSKSNKHYESDDIMEKGVNEFVTTTGIKIKAFGMGEAIRGEVYNNKDKGNVRPDFLLIDDIDNNKNTKNINIIKNDMDFLQTEVFGGMSKDKSQTVCLWNVIRKDGRNPRIKKLFKNNKRWGVYSNFIYWKAGKKKGDIHWDRFIENESKRKNALQISLEKMKEDEGSGFMQNWLWIPLLVWQTFVKEEWIIYNDELNKFDFILIGIDPAFSKKTGSDAFGIVVSGFKRIKGERYKKAIFCKKLKWEKKDTWVAINIIKSLYVKYKARRVIVEWNNGGEVFGWLLKNHKIAVDIIHATKDKVTRLKEHEGDLMRWFIYFSPDVSDLVDQLLAFTWEDWEEDDLVDAFVWSIKWKPRNFVVK